MNQNSSFSELVAWISAFLERVENEKLEDKAKLRNIENRCNIMPANSIGSPKDDATARPTVVLRIDYDKSELRLCQLYLNKQRKGTGTVIVNKLIEYCKKNNVEKVVLVNVAKDNYGSQKFCRSFSYDHIIESNEFYNFIIVVNKI